MVKIKSLVIIATLGTVFGLNTGYAESSFENSYYPSLTKFLTQAAKKQETIWPGFDMNETATIVYFSQTQNFYAYHFTPTNSNWQPITKGIFKLRNPDEKPYDPSFSCSSPIDGQQLFVHTVIEGGKFSPLSDNKLTTLNNSALIAHRFACYLNSKAPFKIKTPAVHDDKLNDSTDLALIDLERQVVSKEKNSEDALKGYAAIEHKRLERLTPEAKNFEEKSKLLMALTGYVTWKTINTNKQNISDTIQSDQWTQKFSQESTILLGFVLGGRLDRALPQWKEQVETQGLSFAQIIETHYSMNEQELTKRYNKILSAYNYDQIERSIKENRLKIKNRVATTEIPLFNLHNEHYFSGNNDDSLGPIVFVSAFLTMLICACFLGGG